MPSNKLINREKERHFLLRKMESDESELIIIYGRRRVGKTFLLEHVLKDALFLTADLSNVKFTMNRFFDTLKPMLGLPKTTAISTWDDFFATLELALKQGKLTRIVIDEFQYIPQRDPSFLSVLQRWWDTSLSKLGVKMILCGSYGGMVEKMTLSQNSPLYGRRTGQYKIRPMDFFDASAFLEKFEPVDRVYTFAVTDGIPLYLNEFSSYSSFEEALLEKVLSPGEFLVEEGRFLTMEEFKKDPSNYFSIMRAIATGKTTPVEIANFSGVEPRKIGTYLLRLLELELIRKEQPFSLKKPRQKPLYFINDEYLRFYFRFIYPNVDSIYRGLGREVLKEIMSIIDSHVSFTFEKVARQYMEREIVPEKIGRWWNKDTEIDVVAVKDDILYVAECKWTSKKVDHKTLMALQRKTAALLDDLKWDPKEIVYYLFSKSGFEAVEPSYNVKLISLETLCSS